MIPAWRIDRTDPGAEPGCVMRPEDGAPTQSPAPRQEAPPTIGYRQSTRAHDPNQQPPTSGGGVIYRSTLAISVLFLRRYFFQLPSVFFEGRLRSGQWRQAVTFANAAVEHGAIGGDGRSAGDVGVPRPVDGLLVG